MVTNKKNYTMRKLLLLACALFGFMACTQNPIEEQSAIRTDAPETIRVGFEDDETRIQLNSAQKTVWTKEDLVSVFYRSDANQKWQYQGETGERVGDLKRVDAGTATESTKRVVVVYPYNENYYINTETYNVEAYLPAEQTYLKDSYGLNGNIMISHSEFNQFSLKSVCGWLKIQLKGEGQVVKKITLKGNNNEQVAGLIYINSADATATLANEQGDIDNVENGAGGNLVFDDTILTEVTLNCGEGITLSGATSTFHIGLPPQTFEKGLTLTVEYSDGSKMTKSTSNSIAIERNTIQPMSTLYYDGNLPPVFELAYVTTDGESLDPYTTEGFGANFVENVYDATTGKGALKFDSRITTIPEKAFLACGNLSEITLTGDIKYIRTDAFNGCYKLAVMDIPNGVTTIGDKAFYNCSGMQEITIPSSVTSIGTSSFEGCGGKSNINCKISNSSFRNSKFTEVIIGDSVTTIGDHAFRNCNILTSVTIGDSVTEIGWYAFADCSSLTSVTIPDSIMTIGNSAFDYCSSPKEIYYTGDLSAWCKINFGDWSANPMCYGAKLYLNGIELTETSIPSDITEIKQYTFKGCTSLTSVTLHSRVTSIGESAFYGCSSLISITIGNRVTSIGNSAFYHCKSLTSITIPDSVTTIGMDAFSGCSSLTSVTIPDSVTTIGYDAFYYCSSLTSVTIGNSVAEIGYRTFYNCSSLTSVTIPDSVTTIGESAFQYCSSLTSVIIPDSVTTIGVSAFNSCSSLESATIGDSVTSIGNEVFRNCSNLRSVTIPDSVTTIGKYAFSNCSSLTSVTIPDSVTTIGMDAFSGCSSLTSVTIPDSVTTIGDDAFFNCSNLTSVTIPDSVTTIGDDAFGWCKSLTSVYCSATTPPSLGDNAFQYYIGGRYLNISCDIYVPTESVEAYKSATNWSEYADAIEGYNF